MITSISNPRIKQIRLLRQRKDRQASGTFLVEGIRLVGEAIQSGAPIETLIVAPELLESDFAQELVTEVASRLPLLEVSAEVFGSISAKDGPQGLAAVVQQQWQPLPQPAQVTNGASSLWVALDSIADPGNLGTILRTCDAVGAQGIILLGHTTDPYDPAAVRGSMGAIFSQRLMRADYASFAGWKREQAIFAVGTSDAAETDYQAINYPSPLVVLMGSERQGLAPELQALCDTLVAVPMVGRSDSLNLAVATGVVLYEIFNQRRRTPGRLR